MSNKPSSQQLADTFAKPIVAVDYARVLLGDKSKRLSDQEILALIEQLDALALLLIDMYKVQKSSQREKI